MILVTQQILNKHVKERERSRGGKGRKEIRYNPGKKAKPVLILLHIPPQNLAELGKVFYSYLLMEDQHIITTLHFANHL